ncbi:MAG: polymorphic toxin-type HINT domain-containing protein, partial [Peptostreptococcaceae bacterium]
TLNQVNTYNGNGQRVEKSENGQSSNYYYQNGSVLYTTGKADKSTELEEPDNNEILTGVTSLNLMGTSENAIATVRDIIGNETYYFYNKDMRESTTNLVDVEGKSVVAYEYTDFGETEIKGDENFYNEIGYTGGIYDNKTGLYYLNARYYNPEDGRFLTEDTYRGEFSDPSSMHLYAYCVNNPIAYTDPSGHIPVWGIINAGFGALDGYSYAKKKNLKGVKKVGAIVGGAVVGTVNPFKKVKVVKVTKKVKKVAKKAKSTKVVAKRVSKTVRKSKVATKKSVKKASKKSSKAYSKARPKVAKKGCFTAGTLISTQDGLIPIEDIEIGDLVWAKDPETGEVAIKEVVQTFIKETDTILYIDVAGEVIEATEQHVFYIDNVGWIPASMIEEGDTVILQSGEKAKVENIEEVVHNEIIDVYNFEVEDFHTYFVSDANVLVHNNGCKEKTYQTYTKTNNKTGEVYSGRTSGKGTPSENVRKRDTKHHMSKKGFGSAVLDKSSTNKNAIRGREQQLIDRYGGAKSMGGTSGNAVNGISKKNKKKQIYLDASRKEFG